MVSPPNVADDSREGLRYVESGRTEPNLGRFVYFFRGRLILRAHMHTSIGNVVFVVIM